MPCPAPWAVQTLGTGAQTPRDPLPWGPSRDQPAPAPYAAGIGKCVALDLARRNARTILACRSRERGQAAVEEIRAATGNPAVLLRLLDTGSLASVRAFAQAVLREEKRLDVLVNNAGLTGTCWSQGQASAAHILAPAGVQLPVLLWQVMPAWLPAPRCPTPPSSRAALHHYARGAGADLRHQLPGTVPAHQPAAG